MNQVQLIKQFGWVKRIGRFDRAISKKMLPYYSNQPIAKTMSIVSLSCAGAVCFPLYFLFLFLTVEVGLGEQGFKIFYHIMVAEFIQLTVIASLKYLFKRVRPIPNLISILQNKNECNLCSISFLKSYCIKLYQLLGYWNQYSFPSLHASRSFMLSIIIYNEFHIYNRGSLSSIYIFFPIFAALTISFSRLVLQKHFLSDVVIGAFIGMVSALVTINFVS
ncbi:MAG: phosphatase PAP2 family protein [Desulfamplus sp.]|nr:phosphatase PAP2 family protein [Desulfamplus sp.]